MVPLPLALTHLAVRWVHVLSMALALGGAVFVWLLLRSTASPQALTVASTYERLFWGVMGFLVMTGVGNLGAFAPSLPGGDWGATLTAKLAAVVVLVLGSLVRSLLVVEARRTAGSEPGPGVEITVTLRHAYAATVVVLGAVVVLAEVLAHG